MLNEVNMVMAKLHLICGNCGSSNDFEYKNEDHFADAEETVIQSETTITCKNCSTIHWLNDNAVNKNEKQQREC